MKQKLTTVTHIMVLVSIGVSVHKYSKSNKLVHVAKHRTCKERMRYIRAFPHKQPHNKQHRMLELFIVVSPHT